MNLRSILTALIASTAALHAQQPGITAETWTGLTPGKSILILRKEGISTRAPNTTQTLAEAKITGLPANSGTRLRATLTPPADDTYTFWVNGTDNAALWISEDGTRFTKRLIANHLGSTTQTEWGKYPSQKSQPIPLTAGVTYHIEAHVMTSVANGHLAIAWQGSKGNWALAANGATATQSTTQWALDASKAIDGNTNGVWNQGTMTTNVQNSWLKVDFAAPRPLNKIVLHNNTQNQNRLSNFRLTALDGSGTVLAQEDFFTTSGNVGNSFTWDMPATVEASSISIQLLGNNRAGNGLLALAEIQAYGPGPYEATRNFQVIPSAFLTAATPPAADTNDNHLPDAWESANGLNPANNGRTSAADGEYGDPDADGLTNLEEFQYGTNPFSADTDGDGISDYDEVKLYGSNPTVSNNLAPVSLTLPALNKYSGATGSWVAGTNGSLAASDRRGGITYTFTVTEAGVHEVVVSAAAISSTPWVTKYLPLILSLDDDPPLARKTLSSKNGNPDTLRAITPWLSAGTHTLTVFHDNADAAVRLRLHSITVSRLGGTDLDEDGIPDWIADAQTAANALTRVPAESRTSPASIEGVTRQLCSASLTVLFPAAQEPASVALNASINDSFFADVPLSEEGAVSIDASFLGGIVADTRSITWIATNLLELDQSELHIRKGDSLRLTAHAPGDAPSGTFTLGGDHPDLPTGSINSDEPHILTCGTAGSYTLTASYGGTTATVTLVVHSADFGASHSVHNGKPRLWTPPVLGATALVEADDRLVFTETSTGGNRTFHVIHSLPANHHVIARLPTDVEGAPSAILARGTVHGFDVARVDETRDSRVVMRYEDGTWLMSITVVAVNLPPDLMIRLDAVNQGTLFTNGATTLELRAGDFDANGIATVYFEWTGATAPKLCHRVKLFVDP